MISTALPSWVRSSGQMEYRCPDASVVGPVTLENYELLFRRGGFATIVPMHLLDSVVPCLFQRSRREAVLPVALQDAVVVGVGDAGPCGR